MAIKFLNTVTAATQAVGDNSTKIATTAYADAAAAAIPIGNYLPLSAGASKPLTGGLHIPHYIYHASDTGTVIGYPSVGRFVIGTNSVTRVDVTNAGLSLGDHQTNVSVSTILDEDDMASDSATALVTQQSIKAYVDAQTPGAGVFLPLTGGTLSGDLTANGDVLLGGSSLNPKTVTIQQIGVTATETTAIMHDGNGVLKTRTLGTGAFGPTPVGAYLPLAAGSGSSLTDNLYINDVDQNNVNRYGNLRSEVGFSRSPVTGNPNQWFKVVALGGSPKRLKFSIIATGDNTNSYDNFLISTSGYGMNMHIEKLPGGRYNTSKLLSVAAINPSNSGSVEIWIKLGPVSSGTGATYVACTSDVLASATILASATTTAPTLTSNDTQLDISGDNRNHATIQTSRGATFGAKVGIGTNAPAAMLTVAGDSTISGNVGIGTTSPSNKLSLAGSGQNWVTSPAIKMWDSYNSKGWYVGSANNSTPGDFYIRSVTTEGAYPVAANQQFTIKQSGNVGIGTISPTDYGATANTLEVRGVSGNGAGVFRVSNGNNTVGGTFYSGSASSTLGTQTAHPLYLITNNSTKMTILSGGNVGIGNTSPDEKLEVSGSSASDYPSIKISNPGQTGRYMRIGMIDSINHCIEANGGSTYLTFKTNATERMRIDTSGNVGIGTDNPGAKLEVFGTGNSFRLDSAANGSKEILFRNVGTGTATIKTDGDLKLFVEDAGKNILFDTNGGEKMRINDSGRVMIGTTTSAASANLTVKESLSIQSGSNTILSIFTGYGYSFINTGASGGTVRFGAPTNYTTNVYVQGTIEAVSSVQMGNNSAAASAANAGSTRYRVSGNNSYMDMSMRTGSTTYAWVNIVQNNW